MSDSAGSHLGAFVLPVLIALVGAYFVADHARFAAASERTTGRVVAAGAPAGTPLGGRRALDVEFTAGGRAHRFTARTGWKNAPDVGSAVEVAYSPADPSRAVLYSPWRPYAVPGLALVFGGWVAVWAAGERRRAAVVRAYR